MTLNKQTKLSISRKEQVLFSVSRSSGVGRTGAFCLLYAALQEIEAGNGIPDLIQLVRKMRQQRKNMLQEKVIVHLQ